MGVVVAVADDVETARTRAKGAAELVRPVAE
jgi:formate-dependent phosphoribosylglycinamide formyltransferase (GAR transformylase)